MQRTKKDRDMLGIDNKRPPIQEPFASQIRDAVRRVSTGQLNENDKRVIEDSEEIRRAYHAVWD